MSLGQLAAQIAPCVRPMGVEDGENEGEQEKNRGEPPGDFREHIGGLGAENIFGDPATEGRAEAFALRALHQDDEHHQDGVEDVNAQEDVDQKGHLGRAIWRNKAEKQTPNVQRPILISEQTFECCLLNSGLGVQRWVLRVCFSAFQIASSSSSCTSPNLLPRALTSSSTRLNRDTNLSVAA